ncbi:hypothetical protein TRFO_18688 [Tritrichomonas foetus]|uniref:Atg6 BARA domain-containing protein n=1 Tax=Tritrichomonas foetus TaxID=1144522 RepID=A0A1J4KQ16_9EUKA|nr:hypothetical protein TRFO_18688 [Tritrichomonas foetus]|eukprot:OHT11790.1 hypothetical protein TRFO_18688 [Tritrichomonas foetus]
MSEKGVVVFVCSMCGEIRVMDSAVWQSLEQQKTQPLPPREPSPEILEPFDDIENWEHIAEFKNLLQLTKNPNLSSFPLCDHCAEISCEHTNRLNEMMAQFFDNADAIERYGQEFSQRILNNVQVLSPFAITQNKKDLSTESENVSNENPNSNPNPKPPSGQPSTKANNSAFDDQTPIQRRITSRFAQLSAFKLTIDGMFAKINGLRLGKLKSIPVTQNEVQNALLFLCQFLKYQMRIVDVDSSNVNVSHIITFTTSKGSQEMKFPERSREVSPFNAALDEMMQSFDRVFNSKALNLMRPSNLIDTKKHVIASETYYYSESDPSKFTRAMRKLIVNLKTIQSFQTLFSI